MPSPARALLFIEPAVIADVVAHARADAPNECCGLLIGTVGRVELNVRARNIKPSPTRYLIDPRDHFAAIKLARASGRSVIGAYHSHPDAAPEPSSRDLVEALDLDFLYLIVTLDTRLGTADVRAWRIRDGAFHEIPFAPEKRP